MQRPWGRVLACSRSIEMVRWIRRSHKGKVGRR